MKTIPWLLAALVFPALAHAGVFVGQGPDLLNPQEGDQPSITFSFDEKLHRATVTITGEQNGFSQTWTYSSVSPGHEYTVTWKQKPGEVDYNVTILMVRSNGEKETADSYAWFAVAAPIKASIPDTSVDLEARAFDLVSNHPPSRVEIEVMDDRMKIIGTSTFRVADAKPGQPVRVTWEQQSEGNIFKITATAHDNYGYWAAVDIIPWALSVPHETVVFESGKHDLLPDEAPKLDAAWKVIIREVDKYSEWVSCALYVAGYTDTVGDASSNQGLSERRARALAQYFQSKGATFPIYYQGFGESVLAVQTADSVDLEANRRALYIITGGSPPGTKDTPRRSWKRLQ